MQRLILVLGIILFTSCEQKKPLQVAKLEQIELEIGGMTCEIGCAKLIESKLAKVEGIREITVQFEDSLGSVTFDKNIIDQNQIVKVLEDIAGGDLYSVKSIETTPTAPLE
jgi:Cu+-exporting ATPase